jgi:hypothetical protein
VAPRKPGRTQPCRKADAQARSRDSRAQLLLAELPGGQSAPEERKAAVSSAVLAGIAAADAACCHSLGERSRSQDHHEAVNLVRQVEPGGADAATRLQRLLAVKDESQYGFGGTESRQARQRPWASAGLGRLRAADAGALTLTASGANRQAGRAQLLDSRLPQPRSETGRLLRGLRNGLGLGRAKLARHRALDGLETRTGGAVAG